jgi:hypothetical protein
MIDDLLLVNLGQNRYGSLARKCFMPLLINGGRIRNRDSQKMYCSHR